MSKRFLLLLLLLAACSNVDTQHVDVSVAIVGEAFVTPIEPSSNMDSPAVWFGAGDTVWVIATGKSTHRLYVHDAATGVPIRTVGERGNSAGEFRRPNGIAVSGDFAIIVERDNARVQILRLPGFEHVITFGDDVLRRPYGLAVHERGGATGIDLFVTDDYSGGLGRTPRDAELGERVKHFHVTLGSDSARDGAPVTVAYVGAFGDTDGAGRLHTVESIAVDPDAGIMMIADEAQLDVKVYRFDGTFTGSVLWREVIRYEPEGITLYACGSTDGYWIVADQDRSHNRFLVFDRRTFELIGAFTGTVVSNTDGIALVQRAVGAMSAGVLYAVHDDRAIGAFAWSDIAAALALRDDC